MSKETREHLSSLVDGEISRETGRFLIRRLGADEELRATWTRYHVVRDCMRRQDGGLAGEDLCARVSKAIENAGPVKSSRRMPKAWLKPVAGVAVAASVALMAVVAVGPSTTGTQQPSGELAGNAPAEQFTSPQSLTPAPYSTQASLNGQSNSPNRRMDSYLLRHYQATEATGGKEFVTFVPIVITGLKSPDETDSGSDSKDEAADKEDKSNLQ